MPYLAETVGCPLLAWLIFVPTCLLQDLVAVYRQEDHCLRAQVHYVTTRFDHHLHQSADCLLLLGGPSSAPSSNRSRSRSRMRSVMPDSSHDVVSPSAAPSATVLPAAAVTNAGSVSGTAATAVPVAAAANPYPINPMFPDNSAGAASSLGNACNMASASCYPFVSQFASFTPAAPVPSEPAHVVNACDVNFNQALMQPPVVASAVASAFAPAAVGHVKHHGVSELTTGFSFQLDLAHTPAAMPIPQNLRTWPLVDRDEFTSCVAYFLRLVHRPPNAQNSFDTQQDVLLTFCQSIVCAGFPYKVAFVTPGQSWVHNNKVIWELETSAFPGPRVRAKSGSDSVYRWFHGTTQSSLLGIMKCGRMLRTCNETVGLRSDQTAYGFFGRACYESDRRAMAQMVSTLTFHSKNQ